ncbi:thiamine phosphate synthase [Polaribacter sp.]|uniref:thiamine phosphate synthase n=1 Tax=Polaribacter sp. TaxID=1920175 RepID=UPI003EF64194
MIPKLQYTSQGNMPKEHIENIQKACSAGAELVQLQVLNLSEQAHLKLAKEAREITSFFQTRLLIHNDYKIARAVKADGVHISDINISATKARVHLYTWQIIGATANTLQECETLLGQQVDYIGLGPLKATTTNNGSTVLGYKGYDVIIDALQTDTPIIGFGGITTADVSAVLATGISGIAVGTEITGNFDIIKKFNQLLSASSTKEQRHTF